MSCTCKICSLSAEHKVHHCREQMFGRGGDFLYFQCTGCGCLQIQSVPLDMAQYYPSNYYSYQLPAIPRSGWKARLAARRDFAMATGSGGLGRLANWLLPSQAGLATLAEVPLQKHMKILDVGCGGGALLNLLHRAGFSSLAGLDPFLPKDHRVAPGVLVRKLTIDEIQERYDLIMLHHVFEHVEAGLQMLQSCRQLLNPGGKILLRFPTVDSDAWESYQEHWAQLDAPRHFFLHSKTSFSLLAKTAGLRIDKWFCDSTAFQFWGSELCRRGCPLIDDQGAPTRLEKVFSRRELEVFAEKAKAANRNQRGDQVVVILSRQMEVT